MKLSNDRRIRLKNTVVSDLIEKRAELTSQEKRKITHLSIFHYFSLSRRSNRKNFLVLNLEYQKKEEKKKNIKKRKKERKINKGKPLL